MAKPYFKRLSFEAIGDDDSDRLIRGKKGVLREVVTPKGSIPLSDEGTYLHRRVDRNNVKDAVKNRNEISSLIFKYINAFKLNSVFPVYASDYSFIRQSVYITYKGDGSDTVDPMVYI